MKEPLPLIQYIEDKWKVNDELADILCQATEPISVVSIVG